MMTMQRKAALVVVLVLLAFCAWQVRAEATRVRADCHLVSVKTITETRDHVVAAGIGRLEYRFVTARTWLCDADDTYKTTIRLGTWRGYQGSPPAPGPIPFP